MYERRLRRLAPVPTTTAADDPACGPDGEPSVVDVDEDRVPRLVADSFGAFMAHLADGDTVPE